jgi:zinc/manganese transport system permease protein
VERRLPREQEAVIGSAFVLAASAALLALADHPRGGEEIQHILAGQILFVRWTEILTFAPVYVIAAGLWFGYPRVRKGFPFFLLFALVVTASVQLVGVYVVFASLILPALAVNAMRPPRAGTAILVGAAAVLAGIVGSTLGDLPAGPVLVFAFAVAAVLYRLARSVRSRIAGG